MWTKTHRKLYKNVSKEAVWRTWSDINNWPVWHDDLEYCTLKGPFKTDNHFMLKPKGMGAVKITLTNVQEGREFTDCTTFFGAKMFNTHTMEETSDGLILTNTVVVTGPLRWIWVKLVAQKIANTIPNEMDALVEVARSTHETKKKHN